MESDREQLREISGAIKLRWGQLTEMDTLEHTIGEKVSFEARGGTKIEGTITKINRKSVVVLSKDGVRWTVTPSLLRKE